MQYSKIQFSIENNITELYFSKESTQIQAILKCWALIYIVWLFYQKEQSAKQFDFLN